MKSKVVTSISIFVLLFISAWFMNEQTKREYIKFVIKETEPIVEYIFTPIKAEAEEPEIWRFKSREYIKIHKREE